MLLFFITYQIIQLLALPFVGVYLIVRKYKRKAVFGNFAERCGFVPVPKKDCSVIWIHAVSVGEILAVERLIDQIKQKFPQSLCYVTTGTAAGKKMAREQLRADFISFMPYDFLVPLLIAFRRINPCALMIMEAELWPNFLMLAYVKKIPIYALNARVNEKPFKKIRLVRRVLSFLYSFFDHIFAQSEQDQKAFYTFGIPEEKISVMGNIKAFNVEAKKEKIVQQVTFLPAYYRQQAFDQKILLVGSLHPGELDVYLKLFKELKHNHPELKLMLAPRHFHWRDVLVKKVHETGFSSVMWDESTSFGTKQNEWWQAVMQHFIQADILIVCILGKLFSLYSLADIFYLGGTFVPVGGHNLLEPAVWGVPSFVGPYYQNCKEIVGELVRQHALFQVTTEQGLFEKTNFLLKNPQMIDQMSKKTMQWFDEQAHFVQMQLDQRLFNYLIKSVKNS